MKHKMHGKHKMPSGMIMKDSAMAAAGGKKKPGHKKRYGPKKAKY